MAQDILSDLLRSVRLRGAVFYYVNCRSPWAAQAQPSREIAAAVMPGCEHVMEFHVFAKGGGWAAVVGTSPERVAQGDIVMFPQGDGHVLSSAPGLAPERRDTGWVRESSAHSKPIQIELHSAMAASGDRVPDPGADTVLVCGFIGCDVKPFNPLVAALPRMLHLPAARAGEWVTRVIEQAVVESQDRRPGGEAVLDRLSEMMFVDSARRYLDSLPEDAIGWLAGLRDRYVGKALVLIHGQPERDWTVEALGGEVGLSRSALHERFVQFVGQPPMQYLANWRIQVGSGLLRATSRNVATIALEVGYDSEAAFARAFKRLMGMPPAAWRRSQRA